MYRFKKGKYYIYKGKDGKFKKVVSIKRSLAADKRKKAKSRPKKKGQGFLGDWKSWRLYL